MNAGDPDLAIVSSLYRAEPHYSRFAPSVIVALRRLAEQGFRCEHLLVVNDASDTDRATVRRIEASLADCPGATVSPIWTPRECLYASWNRGVGATRARAVAFWNADDVRDPDALAEGIERIRKGAQLVYFDWIAEGAKKGKKGRTRRRVVTPPYDPFLYSRQMWFGPFFMFARHLYDTVGPFDEQFEVAGDLDWCVRALHAARRVEKAERAGGAFSSRGAGLSTSRMRRVAREGKWIRLRYQEWDFLPVWVRRRDEGFRLDRARHASAPNGWAPIPETMRRPLVPSDRSIAWFRDRGRPIYRLWTRLLRRFCPRYNLERLRASLMAARAPADAKNAEEQR
jgi:glycosyltransferase involved in cell wall biosynthesis